MVRLTSVRKFSPDDPTQPLTDPLTNVEITEIRWAAEDALPFPLCVSSVTDAEHGERFIDNVSVARGNMVLADHGHTLADAEDLGVVPAARLRYPPRHDVDRCDPPPALRIPPRFRPRLASAPLTFAGTVLKTTIVAGASKTERLSFDPEAPAACALQWRMEDTLPAISVQSTLVGPPQDWESRRDLLDSERRAALRGRGRARRLGPTAVRRRQLRPPARGRRALHGALPGRQRAGRQRRRRHDRPRREQRRRRRSACAIRCPRRAA